MKTVLFCTITKSSGRQVTQYLQLSEVRIVAQMAKENKSVTVESIEISREQYKTIFHI